MKQYFEDLKYGWNKNGIEEIDDSVLEEDSDVLESETEEGE